MQGQREALDDVLCLKTQVVVTMGLLRLAARVHHVDLGRDLKAGAQPGFGNQPQ
ncbi:hypothetical protein D9M71_744820 [compost metagenome]